MLIALWQVPGGSAGDGACSLASESPSCFPSYTRQSALNKRNRPVQQFSSPGHSRVELCHVRVARRSGKNRRLDPSKGCNFISLSGRHSTPFEETRRRGAGCAACMLPSLPSALKRCRLVAQSPTRRGLSQLANLKAGDGPLLSARRLKVDSELGEHLTPIQSLPSPRATAARPRHAQTTMPFALAHA